MIANDDFDEYWQFHVREELKRNHLNRFDDKRCPLYGGKMTPSKEPHSTDFIPRGPEVSFVNGWNSRKGPFPAVSYLVTLVIRTIDRYCS
jgi:hypothetical protein